MPAINRIKLNPRRIETATPKEKPYWLRDSEVPGLAVRVWPSGIKAFSVVYGRGQAVQIGKYPGMTVDAAQNRARLLLIEISQHGAPIAAKSKAVRGPLTLRTFVELHYGPWVVAERRSGEITKQRLLSVFEAIADTRIADLNVLRLDKWKADRLRSGTAAATCNRDLAALKACLNKAVEWGLVESAPAANVKNAAVDDDARVRYLSKDEAGRLRAALAARDAEMIEARRRTVAGNRTQHAGVVEIPADGFGDLLTPLVLTALNTGCRRGELTGLQWVDVDLEQNRNLLVRAHTSKGAKSRVIPLNAEAIDVLSRWKKQNPTGRVFPIHSPKKAWAALLARAEIIDFRFHDCRHDFASRLAMAGVQLPLIRDLLGHATVQMTERYSHLCPSAGAAAVAMLGAHHGS